MMAEYPTPPGDGMAPIVDEFRKLRRRISELERPSGTSIGSLVAQVQAALVDLNAAVIAATNNYLSSGTVNVTNLTASGTISATTALKSSGSATKDLSTVPGNRRSAWQIYDGSNIGLYGYAPSSLETKMNLREVPYTSESFLRCVAYLYEYKAQVAMREDPESEYYDPAYEVPEEVGYMAEHLIENGLEQFVPMLDGKPSGIDYSSFGAVGMTVIGREHAERIASLEERISRLEP
jgi:hypothetical protein